jgi:hypothetical protein
MEVTVTYCGISFTVNLTGNDMEDTLEFEISDCNGDDIESLLNDVTIDAIVNEAVKIANKMKEDDFVEPDDFYDDGE